MKTIICICGKTITGRTVDEVMRLEADHLRAAHPKSYYHILRHTAPNVLQEWMRERIVERMQ